jgi:hypothetical protein
MKDGTVRRLPANQCAHLIDTREAKCYISNTIYRAKKLGIEVKNFKDRDEDGKLRAQIRTARDKAAIEAKKLEEKRKRKEEEKERQRAKKERTRRRRND